MTIRVGPERATLSLPQGRLRSEDARSAAAAAPETSRRPSALPASVSARPSDVAGLRAASALLDRASSIADTALAATGAVTALLEQMRELATSARESGARPDGDFRNLGRRVAEAVRGAVFEGVNLLDGSQGSGAFRLSAQTEETGEITLRAQDLTPGGEAVPVGADSDPAASVEGLSTALANLADFRRGLGEDVKKVEAHRSFVLLLADAREAGPWSTLNVDGARLAALQLKQSLGGQTLAIANQTPQAVLSLFR